MIESFADKPTARVFSGAFSRKLPGDIQARAKIKLITIHHATELQQLVHPLGNYLEISQAFIPSGSTGNGVSFSAGKAITPTT